MLENVCSNKQHKFKSIYDAPKLKRKSR